ncbi:MAG: hypothetical protein HZB16_14315 [Armatimonadetes bacterium]|nr:hypothetical protein [Armatimonadota bacterium]
MKLARSYGTQRAWRWLLAVGLLGAVASTLLLAGCGGKKDSDSSGPKLKRGEDGEDGGGGGLKSRKNADGEDGGGGGGRSAPPPPPAGGPGGPGGPPGGPPGGGAQAPPPAPAVPLDLAASPPKFPGRPNNPFAPLDKPLKPAPEMSTRPHQVTHSPVRPDLVLPPPEPERETRAVEPPDLRTAGLLGGKAIIEQNGQQYTVWPGQRISIEFNGQRQVVVVSVAATGTTLKDTVTGTLYSAPFRR